MKQVLKYIKSLEYSIILDLDTEILTPQRKISLQLLSLCFFYHNIYLLSPFVHLQPVITDMADEPIGIPQFPAYEFTGLTSAVERDQPDPTKRFVGIYYQDPDGTIQRLLRSFNFDTLLPTGVLKLGTPLAAITPPEVSIVCPSHPSSKS